jgi:hypothetical protein
MEPDGPLEGWAEFSYRTAEFLLEINPPEAITALLSVG